MRTLVCWTLVASSSLVGVQSRAESPDGTELASRIDASLVNELGVTSKVPVCDDVTFVRRVFLDLVGRPPSPEDVRSFSFDESPAKREHLLELLLDEPDFGRNWARYWRDVILYRRTEARALLSASSLEGYLTEAFNQNRGWDEIAADFITATGDVRERGETGLIMAQAGRPEDVVAEISRIFLGVQIQCAQCHDHPTDQWERRQFHELAAFFPRVAVRRNNSGQRRSFQVVANDRPPRRARRNNNNRTVGTLEHYMPDLEDPSAKGTKTRPVFFLTGAELPMGTTDAVRRETLAEWITAPDNLWFSQAFVNRIWAELVGEGFCEPVDDLGPNRECATPRTFELLANAFAERGYDVKWLYRTVMSTAAYQRASRSRRDLDEDPFQASCPQRLRGDQLYDALVAALGIPDRSGGQRRGYGPNGPRALFNRAFGYDPSQPREEVKNSIQQALAVMNSRLISRAINGRRGSGRLAEILRSHRDNRTALDELYLQTLSRSPTDRELRTCLQHIRVVGDRIEAFEDLQWALINSTEFLYRQ